MIKEKKYQIKYKKHRKIHVKINTTIIQVELLIAALTEDAKHKTLSS